MACRWQPLHSMKQRYFRAIILKVTVLFGYKNAFENEQIPNSSEINKLYKYFP